MQTSPRKLVGQRSEGEGQRTLSESQGFVADFSHFSPKSELPETTIPSIENTVSQSQQFTGVCGAFHIYRKPSPSKTIFLLFIYFLNNIFSLIISILFNYIYITCFFLLCKLFMIENYYI